MCACNHKLLAIFVDCSLTIVEVEADSCDYMIILINWLVEIKSFLNEGRSQMKNNSASLSLCIQMVKVLYPVWAGIDKKIIKSRNDNLDLKQIAKEIKIKSNKSKN